MIIKGVVHCRKMRVVTVRASVIVAMATPELKPARENINFIFVSKLVSGRNPPNRAI